MIDQGRQEATIAAPLDRLWAVLTDFEAYPGWAQALKAVVVLERDRRSSCWSRCPASSSGGPG